VSRRVQSSSPTVNYRQLSTNSWVTRGSGGRLPFERFQERNEATSMFALRPKSRRGARSSSASTPAPTIESALPDVPSLEGYTIQELRTQELARLIKFDELDPEQVTNLIRVLTRSSR